MSGQRSYGEGGGDDAASSSAAGCELREGRQQVFSSSDRSLMGIAGSPAAGESSSTDTSHGVGNGGGMLGHVNNNNIYHRCMIDDQTNSTSFSYTELACFLWGRGEDGQLGIGDTSDQDSATYVDALRNVGVHQIACGSGHTVVLTREGEVYTWGRGDDGRLGHGDNGWKYVPRIVQSLTGLVVTQVTCGSYHTAAVCANGDLYTWGGGMYGKLGHGNESGHSTPKKVDGLAGLPVLQIACGSRHTAVVTCNGQLYTWGDKENGVTGHGETDGHQYTPKLLERLSRKRIAQLSACGFHTGCITEDMEVYTWGEGKFGRLGHNMERNCHAPRIVESLWGKRPKQIACGGFHTAVVTEDGKVYTFGGGEHGQLGHGDKINKLKPTLVQALDTMFVTQITCGWSHSVGLTGDGKVWTWGNGDHGKLGLGNGRKVSTPQMVEKLSPLRVVKVASYNEHTAALAEPYDDYGGNCCNDALGVGGSSNSVLLLKGKGSTVQVSTSFLHDLRQIVNDEEFCDVTFVVEGRQIHAHRAILAKRCDHFAAMFRSGMRESVEREINIPDVSYDAFRLLMEFLYTDNVKVDVEHAVEVYMAADLYQLDRLKGMSTLVVKRNLSVSNVTFLLNEASEASCHVLKDLCMDFMVANFDIISKREEIKVLSHALLLELLTKRP